MKLNELNIIRCHHSCLMIPVFRHCLLYHFMTTKEKRGIWLLLVRDLRPTTALSSKRDRVIPTPLVYKYASKGVREGMDSLRHTNGNGIYLPVASTSAMS